MKHRWPLRIARFLVFAAVALVVVGFVVMLLWNAIVPDLFKGPIITYWQAVGLLLLSHIFLKGWGRWHSSNGWRYDRWRHRLDEKWEAMSPEEREHYRERLRQRWGCYPDEQKESKAQTQT